METCDLLLGVLPAWNRYIGGLFKRALPEGISPPMCACMALILKPRTMTELSEWMCMSKQQMTKLADRLIELELAERVRDERDRRLVRLAVSRKGLELTDDIKAKVHAAVEEEILASLTGEQIELFRRSLSDLDTLFTCLGSFDNCCRKGEREVTE